MNDNLVEKFELETGKDAAFVDGNASSEYVEWLENIAAVIIPMKDNLGFPEGCVVCSLKSEINCVYDYGSTFCRRYAYKK